MKIDKFLKIITKRKHFNTDWSDLLYYDWQYSILLSYWRCFYMHIEVTGENNKTVPCRPK